MHLFMYVCMCVSIRPTLKPHETTTKPLTKPLDFCHTFDETSGFYKYYLYVQETYFSLERWFRRFVDKIRVVSWLVSWWFRVVSCISLEMRDNSLWVHVCTCVCVYVYMCMCVYVCVHVCMHVCMCMCRCMRMCMCMCKCVRCAYVYVYACMYVWVSVYMRMCMYVHMYVRM